MISGQNGDSGKENIVSRLKKMTPRQWIILLLLGLLLAVAALPAAEGQQKPAISLAKDSDSEEKNQLEKKLESILENMEGVGKVQVMLMTDEKNCGESFMESGGVQVTGVLISAQGGENPVTVYKIQQAVMALFQVEAHKIKIVKMK